MELIGNGWIGLVALVVLSLALFRGVTRWRDLLVTISDAIIAVGVEVEVLAERLWRRQTRNLGYWDRFDFESRSTQFLDRLTRAIFSLGYKFERWGFGEDYFLPRTPGAFGYSAASPVSLPDDADYLDDDEYEFYYGDDARYDG